LRKIKKSLRKKRLRKKKKKETIRLDNFEWETRGNEFGLGLFLFRDKRYDVDYSVPGFGTLKNSPGNRENNY
jgi:hypothetical protein